MSVTCTRDGGDLVVHVRGDLDAATWEEPLAAVTPHLGGDHTRLVLDLGDVTFVDSSGLGSLVELRTLCHRTGRSLVLRRVRPRLSRLLRIAGLEGAFEVSSVSDA